MAEIKSAAVRADAVNMLNRLPRHMPALPVILADIGSPPLDLVARTFGVTVTTVKRWMKHGAPKPVLFSLWWLTRWGMSTLEAEHFNRAQLSHIMCMALQRRVDELLAEVARLERLGDFGAANSPGFGLDGAGTFPGSHRPSSRPTTRTAKSPGFGSQTLTS